MNAADVGFVEADIFTKRVLEILSDEEYSALQLSLIQKPDRGVLIPGGRGLRKLRWAMRGKGKSGGVRVIYYLSLRESLIYLVYVFKKSDKADLSPKELIILADYVKEASL